MNPKYKIALFVVCLVALLAFQAKVVLPVVYDIVASDLFMDDSGDDAIQHTITTDMTGYAFDQCNMYIANDLGSEVATTYSAQPVNAWAIGNYQYVINADIEIMPPNDPAFTRRYVCRIKYDNGDDQTGVSDPENWSVSGVSGLDNL
jgi:hypothetical protein